MSDPSGRRRAGLLIPLFSCASTGELGHRRDRRHPAARRRGWPPPGQRVLQLLPLNEMAPGQQSPYSAISAMAIDPIFISLRDVPEFAALGGEAALERRGPATARARCAAAPQVDHADVRGLKQRGARPRLRSVLDDEWEPRHARARASCARSSPSRPGGSTTTRCSARCTRARASVRGPSGRDALQRREPAAIDRARRELAREVLLLAVPAVDRRHAVAARARRRRARRRAVRRSAVHGGRRQRRRLGAAAAVPPRRVGRRAARCVQRHRSGLGHAGLSLGRDRARGFPLAARARAAQRGSLRRLPRRSPRRLLSHLRPSARRRRAVLHAGGRGRRSWRSASGCSASSASAGAEIIAEDLGTVPDFVRASLGAPGRSRLPRVPLGAPLAHATASRSATRRLSRGFGRDIRHARHRAAGRLVGAGADRRAAKVARAADDPAASPAARRSTTRRTIPTVRDALLEALFASGSDLLLLPVQDVFGWRDRINEPATVSDGNWTFKLPWPCDRLDEVPEARERRADARLGRGARPHVAQYLEEITQVTSELVHESIVLIALRSLRGEGPERTTAALLLRRPRPRAPVSAAACAAASRRGSPRCRANAATITALCIMSSACMPLVDVHVRVVRARVVLDLVLDELEARAGRRRRTTGDRCRPCCGSSASSCRGS